MAEISANIESKRLCAFLSFERNLLGAPLKTLRRPVFKVFVTVKGLRILEYFFVLAFVELFSRFANVVVNLIFSMNGSSGFIF